MTEINTKTEFEQLHFYDGEGLRISRTDNLTGLTTYYVWDTENPTGYPQVVEEIENNIVVRRYGYGHFLENVDIWNGTTFERFYVVRDGINSVRMLLDSAGNVAATYDYDAFGNVLSSSFTNPICSQNNYQFHSEYRDQATGLVYLRARWYEPREGRFLCKDEFEGIQEQPITLNKYVGFNDTPVNLTDPSGRYIEAINSPVYSNIKWGVRIQELLSGLFSLPDPSNLYTQEEYVLLALRSSGIAEKSSLYNREFAGVIIETYEEKYFYTEPKIYEAHTSDPIGGEGVKRYKVGEKRLYHPLYPFYKVTAAYHTHGSESQASEGGAGDIYLQYQFSGFDIEYADTWKINNYLITPDNGIFQYIPGKRPSKIF